MFAVFGREGVCEDETSIGEVVKAESVFAIQALYFSERARGVGGCGKEFERWDRDG